MYCKIEHEALGYIISGILGTHSESWIVDLKYECFPFGAKISALANWYV